MNAKRILFVAPSGCGKTYSMTQWLLQQIKNKWISPRNIIIFAYNYKSDPSLKPLIDKCSRKIKNFQNSHCFQDIEVELLQSLFESQEMIKDTQNRLPPHYLIILDDQVCNEIISKKRSDLSKVLVMGRHCNISIIFCIQKYSNTINPIIRDNMNMICIGRLNGLREIKAILEQYSSQISNVSDLREAYKILYDWYQYSIQQCENKGFITIYTETAFGEGRFELGCGSCIFFDMGNVKIEKQAENEQKSKQQTKQSKKIKQPRIKQIKQPKQKQIKQKYQDELLKDLR